MEVGVSVNMAVGVSVDMEVGVSLDMAVGVSVDMAVGVCVDMAVGVSVDMAVWVSVDLAGEMATLIDEVDDDTHSDVDMLFATYVLVLKNLFAKACCSTVSASIVLFLFLAIFLLAAPLGLRRYILT